MGGFGQNVLCVHRLETATNRFSHLHLYHVNMPDVSLKFILGLKLKELKQKNIYLFGILTLRFSIINNCLNVLPEHGVLDYWTIRVWRETSLKVCRLIIVLHLLETDQD